MSLEGASESDPIKDTLENLKYKQKELQESIDSLRKENAAYQQKYNDLKSRVNGLNQILEKSARVFNQLYDDTKNALQIGRISILNSPVPRRKSLILKNVAMAGPSKVPMSDPPLSVSPLRSAARRKLHIEPINTQQLQDLTEAENGAEPADNDVSMTEGLSTITEESVSLMKDVRITLSRLPSQIMDLHLSKLSTNNILSENSSLNISESFSSLMGSDFSSTPLKLETMKTLGLIPTNQCNGLSNFVSTRKKQSRNTASRNGLVSPKKENKKSVNSRNTASSSGSISPKSAKKKQSGNSRNTASSSGSISPKNAKKKAANSRNIASSSGSISPKKEKSVSPRKEKPVSPKKEKPVSPKKERLSPKTPPKNVKKKKDTKIGQFVNKKRRASPDAKVEATGRPARRAKPVTLKEESLRKKMRRT